MRYIRCIGAQTVQHEHHIQLIYGMAAGRPALVDHEFKPEQYTKLASRWAARACGRHPIRAVNVA